MTVSAKKKRANSKNNYNTNKVNILSHKKLKYAQDEHNMKESSRLTYRQNPERKRVTSRAYSKASFTLDPEAKKLLYVLS